MALKITTKEISDCGHSIYEIEGKFDCEDNISGHNFNGGTFRYQRKVKLKGYIKRLPRETERQISQNCKTQKVTSAVSYEFQALDLYPEWKMNEIEEIFHARDILINGQKVIWEGGKLFEQINKGCPALFRMRAVIEECPKYNIYGCASGTCIHPRFGILINGDDGNTIYAHNGTKIATSFAQFSAYLESQSGVESVTEITEELPCQYTIAYLVETDGTANINKFYIGDKTPTHAVYTQQLSDNADYASLCNGVDNTRCGTISLGTPTVYVLECGDLVLGTPTVYHIGGECNIVGENGWVDNGSTFSTDVNYHTLNLKLTTTTIFDDGDKVWLHQFIGGDPCNIEPQIPSTSTIIDVRKNGILVPYTYNNGIISLTGQDCLAQNDTLEVNYNDNQRPFIGGEIVGRIAGTGCLPSQDIYFRDNNMTIIVESTGWIKAVGQVTVSDIAHSEININNIVYN